MTSPLQLPEPKDVPLRRSPLALVVCQIRHDRTLAVSDARGALELQQQLDSLYPEIEPHQGMSMELRLGQGAPQINEEKVSGWKLTSTDSDWTVTLLPEAFSVETSAYDGWLDFRERLAALVGAVAGTFGPALEQRIGLRYVDEIRHPEVTSAAGWKGWIRNELLGPLAHPDFAPAIRVAQQVIEFDAGDGHRVTLRHGTSQVSGEDEWVYLLDHDCFRQAGRPFDQTAILTSADDLHRVALRVFESAVTDDLYSYLDPEAE